MNLGSAHSQRKVYMAVVAIWAFLLIALMSAIISFDLQRAREEFAGHVQERFQQANDRVHIIESILEGFAAMISVTNDLDRTRIRGYAQEMLEQYPYIFMFEIVEKVPHDQLPFFIDSYRKSSYPDFEVKGFSYESDRQWQPIRNSPYHLPIVFMEPFPPESRKVLGLDISSNVFFMESLRQSELQNRSISSDPFKLVEGYLAYVVHRPIPATSKAIQPHFSRSKADMGFAVLVVRADTLLERDSKLQTGMREILYKNTFDESDPKGYLEHNEAAQVTWLESWLFPHLRTSMALNSTSQPFVLVQEQQLGWRIISWGKLGFALLAALFTFAVMLSYAKLYFRHQIARAERYLQISNAMIVGLDRTGTVTLINRRGCEILGYSEDEIVGRNWFEMMVPENLRPQLYEVFRQMVSGEIEPLRRYENSIQTKNGALRHIDWNSDIETNDKGQIVGTLSSGQDISERKQAEESAQHQQREMAHIMRLSTMGEMATAIAHELNQPLTAIVNYCETADTLLDSFPTLPKQLKEILSRATIQAHRAGDIIRHVREFVGSDGQVLEQLELDKIIVDVIDFLRWEIRQYGVSVQFLAGGKGRKINANKIQIEQVIINLLNNSLQAIGKENPLGTIVVQTRALENGMIETTVTDNGPGVPSSIADSIFLQFQTSKKKGMGVGLSISRTIVEAHGGTLWLDKEFKTGALFRFVLPTVD